MSRIAQKKARGHVANARNFDAATLPPLAFRAREENWNQSTK
jgi:hypothetical protein